MNPFAPRVLAAGVLAAALLLSRAADAEQTAASSGRPQPTTRDAVAKLGSPALDHLLHDRRVLALLGSVLGGDARPLALASSGVQHAPSVNVLPGRVGGIAYGLVIVGTF